MSASVTQGGHKYRIGSLYSLTTSNYVTSSTQMDDLRVVRFYGSCSAVLPCAAVVVKDVVLLVLFPTYITGVVDYEEHVTFRTVRHRRRNISLRSLRQQIKYLAC